MFAAVLAAVAAFQVIPLCEDKIAVFVYVVINAFDGFAARVEVLCDVFESVFGSNGLNVFGYLFLNDNLKTSGTTTIHARIHRHDRRQIIAPAILLYAVGTAAEIRSAT